MLNLSDANNIKGLLIDFLITENIGKDYLIGSEIYFGSKKRQADILFVDDFVTAFEIKSQNDDFRRTREQLNDYRRVFDYQILVTTYNHLANARKAISPNVGLIMIRADGVFNTIRKPQLIKNQEKIEILESVPIWFLKSYFQLSSNYRFAKDVREHLLKHSRGELKNAFRVFLQKRLVKRNNAFFDEKGEITHYEDLWLLTTDYDQTI